MSNVEKIKEYINEFYTEGKIIESTKEYALMMPSIILLLTEGNKDKVLKLLLEAEKYSLSDAESEADKLINSFEVNI